MLRKLGPFETGNWARDHQVRLFASNERNQPSIKTSHTHRRHPSTHQVTAKRHGETSQHLVTPSRVRKHETVERLPPAGTKGKEHNRPQQRR